MPPSRRVVTVLVPMVPLVPVFPRLTAEPVPYWPPPIRKWNCQPGIGLSKA